VHDVKYARMEIAVNPQRACNSSAGYFKYSRGWLIDGQTYVTCSSHCSLTSSAGMCQASISFWSLLCHYLRAQMSVDDEMTSFCFCEWNGDRLWASRMSYLLAYLSRLWQLPMHMTSH